MYTFPLTDDESLSFIRIETYCRSRFPRWFWVTRTGTRYITDDFGNLVSVKDSLKFLVRLVNEGTHDGY